MSGSNAEQIEFWNGQAGEKWAALQVTMDSQLAEVTAALRARVEIRPGQRVLDIGCGTGETCLIWQAAGAEVTGVDVSAPMLALAARRTGGKVTLVEADASVWRGPAPFDLAVSRFGVMFFDDPEAAFRNLAANLRPGGRLLFACWRAPAENAWTRVPMGAIKDLLPDSPPPPPHAPGPFGLADRERLRGILTRAGFSGIQIDPVDVSLCLAAEDGVAAAVRQVMAIGPVFRALAQADEATRTAAAERLTKVLAAHEQNGAVALGGAIWLVEAARPG